MKIILSRKGFDNQYGKQASPILPDGTLLSLPIPLAEEAVQLTDLIHKDQSYYNIIKSLKPNTHLKAESTCHLDPDLRKEALPRKQSWQPTFGQADGALGHLINNDIRKDDLFLFFGTFRQTAYINGKLSYVKDAPDQHLIYAYFQVSKLHTDNESLKKHFADHPHAAPRYLAKNLNGIFEANENLSFAPAFSGSSSFTFSKDLVLTKQGYSKSRWQLPDIFEDARITYHSKNSFKAHYFQSAAKGQEFIISGSKVVENWAKNLIIKNVKRKN
ncbi:hypothetical protein GCM10027429_17970 [Marivirga atlantica]|jgi:hypothetical protein|uniref:Nucleotide modification associated domain-containing protein n=1 Tax=Marivirga atlantica TaxID=1548457 RepID=A0A937A891_9BACT|nr:hypothetical protein [Marivirga atlantica]MBL0765415.1 hypothetical protein [Marivirga atlantica]